MKQKDNKPKSNKKTDKDVTKAYEKLQEDFDALTAEKLELFEKLQRVSADYANYQKRVPKQVSDSVGYEKERILKSLLPVLDNFEHTINSDHSGDIEAVMKGIKIVYDQMLDTLKSHGVEQIQAESKFFDPSRHEAMLQRNEEDKENNLVLEEFQKGYVLNDRVIRPSKVIVNKSDLETETESTETDEPDACGETASPENTPEDTE